MSRHRAIRKLDLDGIDHIDILELILDRLP